MKRQLFCYILVLCIVAGILSETATGAAGNVICRADSGNKIALTFDDGPHPVYTPEILDILSDYGIKATFFVVGKNAEIPGSDNR